MSCIHMTWKGTQQEKDTGPKARLQFAAVDAGDKILPFGDMSSGLMTQ